MGKLTEEVFNESCCDGGACNLEKESAQPCGCDKGANWTCAKHQEEEREMSLPHLKQDCLRCGGKGVEEGSVSPCAQCGGHGYVFRLAKEGE